MAQVGEVDGDERERTGALATDAQARAAASLAAVTAERDALLARNQALVAAGDALRGHNQALVLACDRLHALYEDGPTPYVTVDVDGGVVGLNRAAEAVFEVERDQLRSATLQGLIEAPGHDRVRAFLAALFAAGHARCGDVVLRRPGAVGLDAIIDGLVLLDGDGAGPRLAVLAFVDITARKLAETARRQAQDEMLAIVSHDLRGPINAIGLACDGLAGELPDDERRDYVAAIQRSVARSEQLIGDLLRIAHIESGRLKLERDRFDVRDLLAQVGRDHALAAIAVRSRIALVTPPAPVMVDGDRDRLHQVLSNLVRNALVHARGADLELSAAGDGDEVVLAVVDRGPGIPADELPRVFERYRQGPRRRGGAGLGLAIVKGLVEAHGGTVTVASVAGAGARFEIRLPATAALAS